MSSHRSPCKIQDIGSRDDTMSLLSPRGRQQVLGPGTPALGPPWSHFGLRCAWHRPCGSPWLTEQGAVLLLLQRPDRRLPLQRRRLPRHLLVRLRDLPGDEVDGGVAGRRLEAVLGVDGAGAVLPAEGRGSSPRAV